MIRVIGFIFATMAAPALAEDLPATVPTTQPSLAGRWTVYVTPAAPSPDESVEPSEHLLTFDQHRLEVRGPVGDGFGSATYEYRPPDFRAAFDRDTAGNALWAGELTEHQILRGRIIWTRHDGRMQIYHFAGERTDAPGEQ